MKENDEPDFYVIGQGLKLIAIIISSILALIAFYFLYK